MATNWDNVDWGAIDDAYDSYVSSNPSYSSGSSYQESLGGSGYSDWGSSSSGGNSSSSGGGSPSYGGSYGNEPVNSTPNYNYTGTPPVAAQPAAPGQQWEIRGGYAVPVGTPASWQPGQAFDNPYGAIDAPGFNNQQNIQSVVGDNYTTSQNDRGDTIYHSNWDKDQQALFDSKFAGYAQQNYPDYFNSYEEAQARLAEQQRLEAQKIGNLLTTPQGHQVMTGQATVPDFDPYMIAALDALGSGNQENLESNADATNFTNREGASVAGQSLKAPIQAMDGAVGGTGGVAGAAFPGIDSLFHGSMIQPGGQTDYLTSLLRRR